MNRLALVIIMLMVATAALAHDAFTEDYLMDKTQHASRDYQSDTGFYIVEYNYDMNSCMMPAVANAKPHYGARITVYQVIDGKKEAVCPPFSGQYIPGGCFEDEPKALVERALQIKKGE